MLGMMSANDPKDSRVSEADEHIYPDAPHAVRHVDLNRTAPRVFAALAVALSLRSSLPHVRLPGRLAVRGIDATEPKRQPLLTCRRPWCYDQDSRTVPGARQPECVRDGF